MKSISATHAAVLSVCIVFAASGCRELGGPSMVLPGKAVGDPVAQGQAVAYIGDVFSEAQKVLAALPPSEPMPDGY